MKRATHAHDQLPASKNLSELLTWGKQSERYATCVVKRYVYITNLQTDIRYGIRCFEKKIGIFL